LDLVDARFEVGSLRRRRRTLQHGGGNGPCGGRVEQIVAVCRGGDSERADEESGTGYAA
jgi:hypothetical protein